MKTLRVPLAVVLLALAATVSAQTTPTGTLTGKVTDPDGLIMPGVTVTANSPALQGPRSAVTSGNGDYVIPFLPAGDYKVVFELSGFTTVERTIRLQVAETTTIDVRLAVGGLAETVTVRAETAPADFTSTPTAAASYQSEVIDTLPVSRTINGAVLLAPGTSDTGPSGNVTFSGAFSYEGLFLINGVVANETLRNQVSAVFIEDAIEETKIMTAAITAEYGRFVGGVANTITKSGGNDYSGSFRVTFDSDSWRSLTPYEKGLADDPRLDTVVPTYEATFGGRIVRDRLWFFTAARLRTDETSEQTFYTDITYPNKIEDTRYEVNGTWAITNAHSLKGAFTKRTRDEFNNTFGDVMDSASFYDNQSPEDLFAINYKGILGPSFFVEGQYSRRRNFFIGSGARYTDIERGTMILDRSRSSARWNSPTFCAVCGLTQEQIDAGELNEEKRANQNVVVKASYFLSTASAGSHNFVAGFDAFEDSRQNDNYQSGSGFRLNASNTIFRGSGESVTLYPVVRPGTSDRDTAASYILWTPLLESSKGSQLRTYSVFFNDAWRFSNHWSFNLGVRWDKTDEKDQAGNAVSDDQAWSPRLSASYDLAGDGKWVVNAGFARYVIPITSGIADLGSGAGRTASFQYVYRGPAINTDLATPNPVPAHDALRAVFDWFYANGGTDRPLRSNPSYPGVNRRLSDDLTTPSTWEYSVGFAGLLGSRGSYRVDFVYKDFDDFYTDSVTPGVFATDPAGRNFDLNVVVNTNDLERRYKALQGQIQYRFTRDLTLGGNYTLSRTWGNFNGETASSGPVQDDFLAYVEYKEERWNTPTGDLSTDQRHKFRLWGNYDLGLGAVGRVNVGLLQRVSSGSPYSAAPTINTTPYVTNPGYLTPDTTTTYYFGGRGRFMTDTIWSTDLSLNYYFPLGFGRKTELFARFVVSNLFNNSGQDNTSNQTVYTASNQNPARTMQAFNPFTTEPVEGVHYELSADFGKALSADDYQRPREFYFGGGFRF
jgi:outer membrane receptor protein involved in Fe transport